MKKIITAALLAAVAMPMAAVPTAASAQSHRDHRDSRDRHDWRGQRDSRHDVRRDQRDHRDARDHRYGRDDWRANRSHNRNLYARGSWHAPFRYNSFRAGVRIGSSYYSSRYRINDPWRYHLARPGHNQAWVRHYNDLLLVDTRRGYVIRVIRNFYW